MATIFGNSSDQTIAGTSLADTIYGGSTTSPIGTGNDTINAGDGDDLVFGGDGSDLLNGENQNDTLVGGAGNDTLNGGNDTDTADYGQDGGSGAVTVNLAAGSATDSFGNTDTLVSIENVIGTGLNDVIVGATNIFVPQTTNSFDGGAGIDTVDYSAAGSFLDLTVNLATGTANGNFDIGTDTLTSIEIVKTGAGHDTLTAAATGSTLMAGLGIDQLNGGVGNDVLVGGQHNDTLNGNGGTDTADYSQDGGTLAVTVNLDAATNTATDSFGNTDTLTSIENIIGTALADTVTANVTNTFNNAFSGGAGTDTVTYAASTDALAVNLSAGTVSGTGVGTDTLTAIEIIRTGSGTDIFSAGAGGLGGVTTLDGGAGTDTLTTSAATLDLTGKTLTSIEQITTTNVAGTAFTTGSIATALVIQGAGTNDSVALTGAAFSEAQRTQLFSQGLETIIDSSGTYTANHAPTAVADTGSAQEDGSAVTLTAASLLANDTDPDAGDTKTLVSVDGTGAVGSVSIVAGNVVYDPGTAFQSLAAGATTTDSFTYTMQDAAGVQSTATVTMTITGVNDDPNAGSVADQSTNEDTPLTVAKTLILAGASDVDGGTVALTGGSALHGGVALDVNGNLVYTPNANANGPDVVTYTLSDGQGGITTGTFNVGVAAVDDPGIAQADAFATGEATAITTGSVFADNGSGADSDIDSLLAVAAVNGTPASVGVMITLASGAHLTLNAGGTFVYDPNHAFDALPAAGSGAANLSATDSFTYTLAGGGTATVTVTVSGIDSNDTLVGTAGNDTLRGGIGADHIDGLAGIDAADYSTSAAAVKVTLVSGTGTGGDAQGDVLVGIENLTGSGLDDNLTGSAGVNTLDGGNGNDILEGRGGADVLIGGAGIDTAYYTASTAGVTVNLGLGTGVGGDAQGDTLAGIEQILGSAQSDTLTGDAAANTLWGNGGNDTLRGGLGADVLKGGDGVDTADYSTSAAAVTVTLVSGLGAGGDAQGDKLFEIETLIGSGLDDNLTGSAGVNTLDGGNGNDILEGRGGADVLIGGAGIDTAYYTASAAGVTINLTLGTGVGGDAQGDTLAGIEQVLGSAQADTLIGDAGANTLWGMIGGDTLRGGLGADVLKGGDGVDTADYSTSAAAVIVSLISGLGAGGDAQGDKLFEIEALTGSGLNDSLTGSAGINTLDGGAGNDILEGRGGADVLVGGAGIDTAYYTTSAVGVTVNLGLGTGVGGDAQGDTLAGIEQVYGSAQSDTLAGDAGANTLWGNGGADSLRGGLGADALKGGAGNDGFVYASAADSTVAAAGRDTISDFTTGDRIDLSGIDADGNEVNGDTAFSFGTGGFTGHAGEVRVVDFGGGTQGVYLDINGDKTQDSIIIVQSDHALTAGDFVL
ncbi:beta strand repeat-containing protein [Inquilinus sp. YAF38]|uniref:beta strand repeat-containing protein n=1 Tax=Inquilinus sp. YAF38 TaxID=3233084 RepID=UPI003F8F82A0